MNKNILIVNSYASNPSYGGGMYRHYYLAKEFNNVGFRTTIVSASFSHLFTKFPVMGGGKTFKQEFVDGIDFIWVKTMKYSGSFDKKRVFTWFEFMIKLFFIGKHLKNKPDVIICSPTEVLSIVPCYFLAKKYKAKLVFEVRDIWPLSLIQIGGFSKYNPFIMLLSCVEKFAIKKSDIVVSNLKNYSKHIKDLGIQKQAYWISNGINLRDMDMQEELPQHIKGLVPKDKFIIGYTGKLGVSNSIIYLLKAARILQNNTNIKFIIVGDGQEKQALVDYANDLNNVIFIDPIPKSNIQSMLSLFDVCYIGWLDKELYKFGIAANKLFDYMYSCKPILHSINTSDSIVNMVGFECGIKINSEDPEAIAEAITELYATPKNLMKKMGENGKKAILDQFTYHELAKKYLKII